VSYSDFLEKKTQRGSSDGVPFRFEPKGLFDFQRAMTDFALSSSRVALFEDCGMGKTVQILTWAQNIVEHTNKPVLILSPLAVTAQTLREAEKFDIPAVRSSGGNPKGKIVVTNYEKITHFNPDDYAGVVCDESSILKSFDGIRRGEITEFMRKTPYRLLATATAAPNDYIELGTSSEALGYLGYMDMLNRFFKNDLNNSATRRHYGEAPKWRFKGHAEIPFWRWVCSWARAMRKPSDLGFDDGAFNLPALIEERHVVDTVAPPNGMLFNLPASNLFEQRAEKKRSIVDRCERVVSLVDHDKPAIVWCQLNEEADFLKKNIRGAVEVSGSDSDDAKEQKFMDFTEGRSRVLVTKPKIGALGLNFQHCSHVVYFPSHSFEQYYQAVRRCWRFGQTQQVKVDIVMSEGEKKVMDNLARKADAASVMFDNLVAEMHSSISISSKNNNGKALEVPSWVA